MVYICVQVNLVSILQKIKNFKILKFRSEALLGPLCPPASVITVIIVYMCAWGGVVGLGYALLLPQLPLSRNGIVCVV